MTLKRAVGCPAELREYLLNAMRSESSANLIRRQRIMHLLAEMKAAGIDAKVLKGYAVSGCYAHPECRGSVDTDLLIDVKQEKAAIALLESKDFLVSIRGATSHHSVCQHKKFGMLELHVALYAELIRDIWFGEVSEADLVQEPCIESMDEYGQFVTLVSMQCFHLFINYAENIHVLSEIGCYCHSSGFIMYVRSRFKTGIRLRPAEIFNGMDIQRIQLCTNDWNCLDKWICLINNIISEVGNAANNSHHSTYCYYDVCCGVGAKTISS